MFGLVKQLKRLSPVVLPSVPSPCCAIQGDLGLPNSFNKSTTKTYLALKYHKYMYLPSSKKVPNQKANTYSTKGQPALHFQYTCNPSHEQLSIVGQK